MGRIGQMNESSERIVAVLKAIPHARVMTYGQVAAAAGLRNGARQVARLLHSLSSTLGLPWYRVIKSNGCIALPPGGGMEIQAALLREEGVVVSTDGRVDQEYFI